MPVKKKRIQDDLLTEIDQLFKNLYRLDLDVFQRVEGYETYFLYSSPFLDEEAYPLIYQFSRMSSISGFRMIEIPFQLGSSYIYMDPLPEDYSNFSKVMVEELLQFSGGIFMSGCSEILGISMADVDLFVLQVPEKWDFSIEIQSDIILSSAQAQQLIDDHLRFLANG